MTQHQVQNVYASSQSSCVPLYHFTPKAPFDAALGPEHLGDRTHMLACSWDVERGICLCVLWLWDERLSAPYPSRGRPAQRNVHTKWDLWCFRVN